MPMFSTTMNVTTATTFITTTATVVATKFEVEWASIEFNVSFTWSIVSRNSEYVGCQKFRICMLQHSYVAFSWADFLWIMLV